MSGWTALKMFMVLNAFTLPWIVIAHLYDFRPTNFISLSGIIAGMWAESLRRREANDGK